MGRPLSLPWSARLKTRLALTFLVGPLGLLLGACAGPPLAVAPRLTASDGVVACVDRYAARAGAAVLAEGGNAVDGAVATALALAVTFPVAGNLGGGGMAVVVLPDGRSEVVDFRETAPAAVGIDLFLDEEGRYDPALADHPWRNVGVPGSVAGLHLMHARHGRLPWVRVVQPAVELARDGFAVSEILARFSLWAEEDLAEGAAGLLDDEGRALEQGAVLRQPELAATLERVRDHGTAGFYGGPVAEAIARGARLGGGFLTVEDLAAYRPVLREPLTFPLTGHEVLAPPPPSAGGVTLAQVTGMLSRLPWSDAPLRSADEVHLWAEASRRAFADRAEYLGDPGHADVPTAQRTSPEVVAAMAGSIDPERATPSASLGPSLSAWEPHQTTHISVLDGDGGAVSLTTTLEAAFGSKVMAPGTGVVMNNELRDFNRWPGVTDDRGLVGTPPNLAAPGKRPLSSMTPVIVLDDEGEPVLVTGSPGGRTIPSTVGRLLLTHVVHGVPLPEAVDAPRAHHGWFPDHLAVEPDGWPDAVLAELRARGHELQVRTRSLPLLGTQGAAHSAARDGEDFVGVGDQRRGGWAAGVVSSGL
jgi:gamma-glutamyltranspeptidase/glutathione hydrolase